MIDTETYTRGAAESVVERFEIQKLHGYRTITLESSYAATILIAQNGAGKTTLMNALDAVLRGQFFRLKHLKFSRIVCRLRNYPKELVIEYDDIQSIINSAVDSEIAVFAKRIQVDAQSVLNFLVNNYNSIKLDNIIVIEDPIFEAALRLFSYNRKSTIDHLEKLQSLIYKDNPNLLEVSRTVESALEKYEILYLPTFRRIESPLAIKEESRYARKRSQFKIPFSTYTGDVQFGLSDISDRLSDLNQEIVFESNRGYRELSAGIIREMLDGTFDKAEISDFFLPSSEDLNLFFARLKEGRRVGPFIDFVVPDIDKIINAQNQGSETNRFLLYFISKLNSVMQSTKDIESRVEEFVYKCNNYLSYRDIPENDLPHAFSSQEDIKELRLNRSNLSVYAVSLPTERKIALDALSSGEKQMISLLAKLYLYSSQKIILIDEPELSLSIDWQRLILEDVINAPTCSQLVAITHSPFVFDNPLEPFARSLKVTVDSASMPELDLGDDVDGELGL